jgi:hypothetical protein
LSQVNEQVQDEVDEGGARSWWSPQKFDGGAPAAPIDSIFGAASGQKIHLGASAAMYAHGTLLGFDWCAVQQRLQ